jgi:4-amino-4-deoxy-L-arabinose transferase-like glycosyltransferase
VALLVALGMLLFLWRLGGHDLWPTDEPRFGQVAREMWERGDHVVLSLNDHLYTEKPPLFFWAVNGVAALRGGVDEWAARLPSAVAAILAMLLIRGLGARLFDRRAGFLGALIFATSLQILERGRWASIDMTLNLFVLAAIVLLWSAAEDGPPARLKVAAAWLAMGLATLAKGPVGLVLPLLATLPPVLWLRGWRSAIRLLRPDGILLYLGVTLAWFGTFAVRVGPGTAIGILTHQTVERYVGAWNNQQPFWFYLWRFPVGFFPWVLLLPTALVDGCVSIDERERRATLFLTAWLAAILIFFSFSTGKRGVYIIPAYPAAALLVARFFGRAAAGTPGTDRGSRGRLTLTLGLTGGVLALAAIALVVLIPRRHPELGGAAWCTALLLASGGGAAWWLTRSGSPHRAAGAMVGAMIGILFVGTESVIPWANGYLNLRGFATEARGRMMPGVPVASTEEKRDAWVYYSGRFVEEVDTPEEVAAYFSAGGPRDLLIDDPALQRLRGAFPPAIVPVYQGRVSGRPQYLMRLPGPP